MAPVSSPSSSTRTPGRKDVLFCPSCDHESPAGGDWRRQAREDGVVYRCPSCGVDVAVRPSDPSVSPLSRGTADESMLARSVRLAVDSVRLTVAWATWPCTHRRS